MVNDSLRQSSNLMRRANRRLDKYTFRIQPYCTILLNSLAALEGPWRP